MKSTVLFLAAFTFSGAVFAQSATVKTGGSVQTTMQPGQAQAAAGGSSSVTLSGPAGSVQTEVQQGVRTTAGAAATHAQAAGTQAIQASAGVIDAQATAQQTLKTNAVAVPSGVSVATKQTLKAGTGVINAASGINAATRQAVKVPQVRVNTKITGGAGLGIL